MIDHDAHFKDLLRTFFAPFLQAFVPELHRDLEPGSIEFWDKELIQCARGARKRQVVDLLVRVRFRGEPSFVLVHVEHQARRDPDIAWRLFSYAARLVEQFRLPVYPILITSYDSPRKAEPNRLVMRVRGPQVLDFRFRVVQLNRMEWRRFVRLKNPASTALMAKMRIAPGDHSRVKLQVLRLLASLRLDRKKMDLIAGFVDTYLALSAKEELALTKRLHKITNQREKKTIMRLITHWERRGLEKGLAKGRREGELAVVKRLLQVRVGKLSPALGKELERLNEKRLRQLAEALLKFHSAGDLHRWLGSSRDDAKAKAE